MSIYIDTKILKNNNFNSGFLNEPIIRKCLNKSKFNYVKHMCNMDNISLSNLQTIFELSCEYRDTVITEYIIYILLNKNVANNFYDKGIKKCCDNNNFVILKHICSMKTISPSLLQNIFKICSLNDKNEMMGYIVGLFLSSNVVDYNDIFNFDNVQKMQKVMDEQKNTIIHLKKDISELNETISVLTNKIDKLENPVEQNTMYTF
jgi:predicted small integral membrane protein